MILGYLSEPNLIILVSEHSHSEQKIGRLEICDEGEMVRRVLWCWPWRLLWCARAAMKKYPRLSGWNNQIFFSSAGGRKSKIKVSAGFSWGLPSWLAGSPLLPASSHAFPCGKTSPWYLIRASDGEQPACNARSPGSIARSERSPGEGNGNPHQYSHPENSMDRGAWWSTVAKRKTRLSKATLSLTLSFKDPSRGHWDVLQAVSEDPLCSASSHWFSHLYQFWKTLFDSSRCL